MTEKENPRLLYKRDGISFYAVSGNADKDRAARQCYRCGGEPSDARITSIYLPSGVETSRRNIVLCDDCGFSGPEEHSRDSAVVMWNKLNYERANRPKWIPYAIGFSVATIITVINMVTCFYR